MRDTVAGVLGHAERSLAARYHQLDDYPEATFGRAYADFIARNRFSYPGEVGGPPPPVMRHDCCHILGGYGTTPSEECAVLAFQAGFEKAEVTSGGLALEALDPGTLRVRGFAGLWVFGEVIDVDGPIGGLNFQAAFATAELAGRDAARG